MRIKFLGSSSESESEDEKDDKNSGSGKEEAEKKVEERMEEGEAEECAESQPVTTDVENDHINNASDSDKDNYALPSDLSPSLIEVSRLFYVGTKQYAPCMCCKRKLQ